ncbi:hypothetical protein ACTOB_004495 [Actinoplanes oblitus]|uniref:Trypsin-co-occurring domain-containing protein n=1 Tax=Actinoplanes oblitus TaxID=3040509 RepID=A0ABY8W5W8_9ACTN|nr:trypco2 family protein [Actinoplanes oblitus]WIM92551.1 hypothetical protein ACTOB_004495 [Actinoplanes oblitus]
MADDATLIGLADFLRDLRAELTEAQSAADGQQLRLGIDEIEITMDVVYTTTRSAETSGKIGAKFWVVASAEAAVKGALGSAQANTQRISLKLKPRVEVATVDQTGATTVVTRGLDVHGAFAPGEELPSLGHHS